MNLILMLFNLSIFFSCFHLCFLGFRIFAYCTSNFKLRQIYTIRLNLSIILFNLLFSYSKLSILLLYFVSKSFILFSYSTSSKSRRKSGETRLQTGLCQKSQSCLFGWNRSSGMCTNCQPFYSIF